MDSITVTLPTPPSLNNAFVNVRKVGRIKSAAYRAWCASAHMHIIAEFRRPRRIVPPYAVDIGVGVGERADIDNLIKPLLDIMVTAGVMDDDRHVRDLRIVKRLVTRGCCVVTVTGI